MVLTVFFFIFSRASLETNWSKLIAYRKRYVVYYLTYRKVEMTCAQKHLLFNYEKNIKNGEKKRTIKQKPPFIAANPHAPRRISFTLTDNEY